MLWNIGGLIALLSAWFIGLQGIFGPLALFCGIAGIIKKRDSVLAWIIAICALISLLMVATLPFIDEKISVDIGFFSSLWDGIKIGGIIIGTFILSVILLVVLISYFIHLLSYVSRNPSSILHFFIDVAIVFCWVLTVFCSVSMMVLSLNNIPYFPYRLFLWSGLIFGVTVCCISRKLFAFTFWTCIIINGFVIGLGLKFYDFMLIHKWTSPPPVPYGCILFQGLIFGIACILYYTVLKKPNDDCGY